MHQRALKNILLVGAALSTLAAPALADSYFFRTKPEVSAPAQAFSFAPQANQNPGSTVTSPISSVKGYKGKSISVSGEAGAAYQVCSAADCSDQGSTWRTAATSGLPESFFARARVTASVTFLGSATASVSVGGAQAAFVATTRAKDEAPDTISFASKTGVAGSNADSDIVQLRNHEGVTVAVTGTNATFRVCADATCSTAPAFDATSKAAANNAWVQIRQVAPAVGQPTQVASLRYGSQAGVPMEATFGVTGTAQTGSASVATMGFTDANLRDAVGAALGNTTWSECLGTTGISCNGAAATLVVFTNTATGSEFGVMARVPLFGVNSAAWVPVSGFLFSNAPSGSRKAYVFDDTGTATSTGSVCAYRNGTTAGVLALSATNLRTPVGGFTYDSAGSCVWSAGFVLTGGSSGQSVAATMKVYRRD